jgi:hypothetical protein
MACLTIPAFAQGLPAPNSAAATPVMAVFSGANTTSATAVLPAAVGKLTYVCGFTISGLGATSATPVVATLGTMVGGLTASITYVYVATATNPTTPINIQLTTCMPANAVNTALTLTLPGAAGNTATQITVHGFQL